jgi:SHS2 domain-containing protein
VGSDHATLLVELLGELIYLAETEGFVATRAAIELSGGGLHATLHGLLTTVDPLVKAATYHSLAFEKQGNAWHARVVLDV